MRISEVISTAFGLRMDGAARGYARGRFRAVGVRARHRGCASMPPGMDAPKTASIALANPETTALGKQVEARAKAHPGLSGFELLTDGAASFALHLEIAARAQRTLDVQYFLMQQDDTGKLLLEALLEAADRGVRVRLLLDDAQAFDKGSSIRPLAAHPTSRSGSSTRSLSDASYGFPLGGFIVANQRLNYRMHNKLLSATTRSR